MHFCYFNGTAVRRNIKCAIVVPKWKFLKDKNANIIVNISNNGLESNLHSNNSENNEPKYKNLLKMFA